MDACTWHLVIISQQSSLQFSPSIQFACHTSNTRCWFSFAFSLFFFFFFESARSLLGPVFPSHYIYCSVSYHYVGYFATLINPLRAAVPLWGESTQNLTRLSPKRDCSSKRVKYIPPLPTQKSTPEVCFRPRKGGILKPSQK